MKIKFLFVILLSTVTFLQAQAVDIYRFDNKSIAGNDWLDGQNWRIQSAGDIKGQVPGAGAEVRYNFGGAAGSLSSDAGTIGNLRIGHDDSGGTLTLNEGAQLVVAEPGNYIGWNARDTGGKLIVNGGHLTYLGWVTVANEGAGTFELNGGEVRVENAFFNNLNNKGGLAITRINGGLLDVNAMTLNSGRMEISGGVVRIRAGTSEIDIQNWINQRLLKINGSDDAVKDFHYTLIPWGQSGVEIRIKPVVKTLGLIGA